MKNYVSTENSLKRFLKRKVKITLGMVVAFMITGTVGFGEVITEPINKEGIAEAYKDTIINDININSNNSIGIQLNSLAVKEDYHDLKIESKDININLNRDGNCRGINNVRGSKLTLGKNETENIKITVTTITNKDGKTIGVANLSPKELNSQTLGSEIITNGKKFEINVKTTDGTAVGVQTQHNTNLPHNQITDNIKVAKVEINSNDTVINVNSINGNAVGLACFSNSNMDIKGNLTINAKSENSLSVALNARGNSILNINQNGDKKVVLNGDIYFQHEGTHEGEKDTRINLNLSTKDSILNGKIYRDNKYVDEDGNIKYDYTNLEYDKGNGMLLSLSNEAQWNNTGDSFVTDLTLNNGIINNSSADNNISVGTLKGNSGVINMAAVIDETTGKARSGKFEINSTEKENTKLDVNFTGITADDISNDIEENLESLAGNITGNGVQKTDTTVKVEEGLTNGAITGDLGTDGKIDTSTITQNSSTSTMDGLQALTTNTYIAWKQEMNSLNKRMGELRDSSAKHGVWARVYAGKSEYNSGYENKYQTYQVGYDKKYAVDNGKVFFGYLVSYTQGDTDYSHNSYGSGENTSIGGGIYGTWLKNNGEYTDLIFKVSRLESDFDVTSKNGTVSKGEYDTFGVSLGAEYGRRFDVAEKFFIEPSISINIGRVGAEEYSTNSGLNIKQGTIYTAEGKVGTALGYNFDKGNVYLRIAGVKEFKGELDTTINDKTITEDFGDNWIEYGVGANYRFTENMNVYVDVQKTGEATVDNKWQGNLGFRYEF